MTTLQVAQILCIAREHDHHVCEGSVLDASGSTGTNVMRVVNTNPMMLMGISVDCVIGAHGAHELDSSCACQCHARSLTVPDPIV